MSTGRIPREFIEELLLRVDIVDVIASHVPLKKSGSNFVARCPFHSEKTPSFSVNRKKQFFHCFGCRKSGNAIGFLMEFSQLDFIEAVTDLAIFAGLSVPSELIQQNTSQTQINFAAHYAVMDGIAAYYVNELRTTEAAKKAVTYLKSRGIDSETAACFMLGYALGDWQALTKQFEQAVLIEVGLLGEGEGGRPYARFRDRLVFPIRDKRARIIGFGGRVLGEGQPKYLNSPESPLFHKSKEVYGLYEVLKKHAKPVQILVVEGYLDVITLAQAGVDYAVATLGTAVSEAHLELIYRYTSEIVFCFDGDKAGREASWKAVTAIFSVLKEGRLCRVMLLPSQHDPDSYLREHGKAPFLELIQQAQALSDYFFWYLTEHLDLSELESRASIVNKSKQYLEKMPPSIYKDMMLEKLQELSKVNVTTYIKDTDRNTGKPFDHQRNSLTSIRLSLERRALIMLIQHPVLVKCIEEDQFELASLDFKGVEIFLSIFQFIRTSRPVNTALLLEMFRGHPQELVVNQLAGIELDIPISGLEAEFIGSINRLVEQAKINKFNKLLLKFENKSLNSTEQEDFKQLSKHRIK